VASFEEGEQNAEDDGEKDDQEQGDRSHGLEEGAEEHPLSGGMNDLFHALCRDLRSFRHGRLSFRGERPENVFQPLVNYIRKKMSPAESYFLKNRV
jgi:hypothetical protein